MTRRPNNQGFFEFHSALKGYDLFYKKEKVPIFILYWRGYDVVKIIFNRTDIKAIKR